MPRAVYVQTYRDVREVVGSLCSLRADLMSLGSNAVDLKAIGRRALDTRAVQAQASVEAAARYPDDVISIHYKTLTRDPLSTVRVLYERTGLPVTVEAETAMNTWLVGNPEGRHGRHRYSLADFGLTEREVLDAFRDYMDMERHLAPA